LNKKLEFDVQVLPYEGNDSWIDDTIVKAHQCLMDDKIPQANEDCDYCNYNSARINAENKY